MIINTKKPKKSSRKESKMEIDCFMENWLFGTLKMLEAEVKQQLRLWGTEFDDKNTANDWVAYICRYVAEGAYGGRQNKYTPERFKEHLIKAASLCISAIITIERNKDCAPRHYEGLPRAGSKEE